jgi:hypothetical protein
VCTALHGCEAGCRAATSLARSSRVLGVVLRPKAAKASGRSADVFMAFVDQAARSGCSRLPTSMQEALPLAVGMFMEGVPHSQVVQRSAALLLLTGHLGGPGAAVDPAHHPHLHVGEQHKTAEEEKRDRRAREEVANCHGTSVQVESLCCCH